jgi:hypothetical protein
MTWDHVRYRATSWATSRDLRTFRFRKKNGIINNIYVRLERRQYKQAVPLRSRLEQDGAANANNQNRTSRHKRTDLRNLAPDSRRLGVLVLLLAIHLVKFTTTGAKVHLVQPDPLGLLEEFPEYKEPDKDWQRDAVGRAQRVRLWRNAGTYYATIKSVVFQFPSRKTR